MKYSNEVQWPELHWDFSFGDGITVSPINNVFYFIKKNSFKSKIPWFFFYLENIQSNWMLVIIY